MPDKIKLTRAVITEGKYDKIKLSAFLDALIVTTEGFGIFKDAEKKAYIKKLAAERGLLIITDSDSAGFLIRNYLKSFIDDSLILNAYIPQVAGKERRKAVPSKEGTLGVEGLSAEIITQALAKCGALDNQAKAAERSSLYTAADLYNLGLAGREDSGERKKSFAELLGLPKHINTKSLIKYMNTADEEEIKSALKAISN